MVKAKLDKKKLDHYKKLLFKIRDGMVKDIKALSKNPNALNSDAGDVSGHVLHMADVATDMYDREFALGLASNEREVLFRIEAALKKVEGKSYGFCEECTKSIAAARLEAIPYAETCIKCQEKSENEKR
jgi:RNA polymerase-binding protein DksA